LAIGEKVGDIQTVNNNGFLTIQAPAGTGGAVPGYTVHNILYAGAVEFYHTNGTLSVKGDNDTTNGWKAGYVLNVSNTLYWQVKNVSGASMVISWDGVQTS
jgi:hypothetical protein